MVLIFFTGHGFIPVMIRVFCRRWRDAQPWEEVPAHVVIWDRSLQRETEATVKGIRSTRLETLAGLHGVCKIVPINVPNIEGAREFLESQENERYGFEAVVLTGLAEVSPNWIDRIWLKCWSSLRGGKGGRTSPLHCSLLCHKALEAGGVPVHNIRRDGLPLTPNDLLFTVSRKV